MKDEINLLAELLVDEQKLKEELKEKQLEFEESIKEFVEKHNKLKEKITVSKKTISSEATEEFKKTGEKKFYGGIGIRVMTKLNYKEDDAFGWAMQHDLCLKLDSRAFEKLAKSQNLGFVKKEEKVTVTFPSEIKIKEEK